MKAYKMLVAATITAVLLVVYTQAQDTGFDKLQGGAQVVVKGKVLADKDASGLITSLRIINRDHVYYVVLDENGNFFGQLMNCKYAVVVGWLSISDDERWLTVSRFAEPDNNW